MYLSSILPSRSWLSKRTMAQGGVTRVPNGIPKAWRKMDVNRSGCAFLSSLASLNYY